MTSDYLLSNKTAKSVEAFTNKPHHALLLIGDPGVGKKSVAELITKRVINDRPYNEANVITVTAETNSIGIDQIREIKNFLRLKTTGSNTVRRVVIIENGNLMTNEAQNSLLKILEEPPLDTLLIITASNELSLRPTIVSRCHIIKITKPTLDQAVDYFVNKSFHESEIKSNYLLSNGNLGLLSQLLSNKDDEPLVRYVSEIKTLLQSSKLDKLIMVDKIAKDKENINYWVFAFKRICDAGLKSSIKSKAQKQSDYWLRCLKSAIECENEIFKGSNLKLSLSKLLLEL